MHWKKGLLYYVFFPIIILGISLSLVLVDLYSQVVEIPFWLQIFVGTLSVISIILLEILVVKFTKKMDLTNKKSIQKQFLKSLYVKAYYDLQLSVSFSEGLKHQDYYIERSISEDNLQNPSTYLRSDVFANTFKDFITDKQTRILLIIGMGNVGKSWAMFNEVTKVLPLNSDKKLLIGFNKTSRNHIPITLLIDELTSCEIVDILSDKLCTIVNLSHTINSISFWKLIDGLNKKSKGVVFFIDDLSKPPINCPQFFEVHLNNFIRTAVELNCQVVLTSRTNTYLTHLKKSFGGKEEDKRLFGLKARIISMPLFTPEEAYLAWEKREGPIVKGLKKYIHSHQFLCHPLLLKYTVDLAKKQKEHRPENKMVVFDSLLKELFHQLPERKRQELSTFELFFNYLFTLAKAVHDNDEFSIIHEPQIDSTMMTYQLFYRDKEGKTKFVHDTFFAYLLMRELMQQTLNLESMNKSQQKTFVHKVWYIALNKDYLIEIVEFTIQYLISMKKVNPNLTKIVETLIKSLIDYGKEELTITTKNKEQYIGLWFYIGNALFREEFYEKALLCTNQVLEIHSNHLGALNNKGVILYRLSRLEEAVEIFENLTQKEPDNSNHWKNLANINLLLDKEEKASVYLEKALDIDLMNKDSSEEQMQLEKEMKLVKVNFSDKYLDTLDELMCTATYPNRSEAIRVAIRDLLKEEKKND